jgi:hypothetical protein
MWQQMSSYHLFTSIKPPTDASELAYLTGCLDSWRAAGFSPVAVNGPKEIEALRQFDLGIKFVRLPKDGKPGIGAIFSAIRESGDRFAGIINSDCKIVKYPGLAARLRDRLDGRLLLAWRIDLDSDLKPTTRRGGFDAFFFDTNVLPADDGGFSIAEPWWDYWFPLACEMNGACVETLALPLLTHKYHPENWSSQNFINAGRRFRDLVRSWHRRGDMPISLIAKMPEGALSGDSIGMDQLAHLAAVPPFWLFQCRPQQIPVLAPEEVELETLLRFGGESMYNEVLRQERENRWLAYEMEIAEIRNSTCWRITAPLRRAVMAGREVRAAVKTHWTQFCRLCSLPRQAVALAQTPQAGVAAARQSDRRLMKRPVLRWRARKHANRASDYSLRGRLRRTTREGLPGVKT